MSHSPIPEGFQTVSPYFCVENAMGFIEFLVKAFDAQVVHIHKEGETIVHARIKIGNSLIELSEAKPAFPARQFACQLFVPDCDEVYKKAVSAGADSTGEPADMPYGLRAGYVKDAWGNNWYISTQIEDKYSPEYW
jgi:PhnB protein